MGGSGFTGIQDIAGARRQKQFQPARWIWNIPFGNVIANRAKNFGQNLQNDQNWDSPFLNSENSVNSVQEMILDSHARPK
jgi:hypothetical protein